MLHKWTAAEIEWMQKNVPGQPMKESYKQYVQEFGMEDVTIDQYNSAMHRYKIRTGRDTKRKKGQSPANKGKKMSAEQYEKVRHTFFKPGQKPPQTLPIGAEKVANGYTWVKVADKTHASMQENFKLKHHMVWEEHNGPIQPGEVVIFLDGDRTNITIENLQKITYAEHRIMNRKKLRHSDPEITKTGVAAAKLMAVIHERTKDERKDKNKKSNKRAKRGTQTIRS